MKHEFHIDRGDCPGCGKKRVVISVKDPDAGSLCTRCGWSRVDPKAVWHALVCGDCKTGIGGRSFPEGRTPQKHICRSCFTGRRAGGAERDPNIHVHYPSGCMGACGDVVVHMYFPETADPDDEDLRYGYCDDCAKALPPPPEPGFDAVFVKKRMQGLSQALKDGKISEREAMLEFLRLGAE